MIKVAVTLSRHGLQGVARNLGKRNGNEFPRSRRRIPLKISAEFGGEQQVLLKYGVRSLHCVWNRCKRVGGMIGHFAV